MVAHLDEIVRIGLECFFLNLAPFNPRFQGTWIVSVTISTYYMLRALTFNPRFQGTWIVRSLLFFAK
jgi:uncharacterized cupin superfamily protein